MIDWFIDSLIYPNTVAFTYDFHLQLFAYVFHVYVLLCNGAQ